MRYIEVNPVRAHMVARPAEYPWSGFRANACGADDNLVRPHLIYLRLGRTPEAREAAYRNLFQSSIHEEELRIIRVR